MDDKTIKFDEAKKAAEEAKKDEFNMTYRLEEMYDAMQKSIENAKSVREEQIELLRIVKDAKTEHDFKEFIEAVDRNAGSMEIQVNVLTARADLLKKVIDEMHDNVKANETCNMLIAALGVFDGR